MTQYRIYIAGPHRAATAWAQEQNVRMAEGYSLAVWQAGHVPICPHTQLRNYHDSIPGYVIDQGVLTMLEGCHAALVLPNWDKSEGTLADIDHAKSLGMPVEYALTTSISRHVENLVKQLEGAACISR